MIFVRDIGEEWMNGAGCGRGQCGCLVIQGHFVTKNIFGKTLSNRIFERKNE